MNKIALTIGILCMYAVLPAQKKVSTFWKPTPTNYEVKQAMEIETLPFFYLSDGYHISLGYRYERFRFRASLLDAGTFDSDTANKQFSRFEVQGTFGLFAGYNVWKNLETYIFFDRQVFNIQNNSTEEMQTLNALSPGLGLSYQFFIGRYFYIQPGVHLYTRQAQTATFNDGQSYELSSADFFPVLRLGVRLWKDWK